MRPLQLLDVSRARSSACNTCTQRASTDIYSTVPCSRNRRLATFLCRNAGRTLNLGPLQPARKGGSPSWGLRWHFMHAVLLPGTSGHIAKLGLKRFTAHVMSTSAPLVDPARSNGARFLCMRPSPGPVADDVVILRQRRVRNSLENACVLQLP